MLSSHRCGLVQVPALLGDESVEVKNEEYSEGYTYRSSGRRASASGFCPADEGVQFFEVAGLDKELEKILDTPSEVDSETAKRIL